MSCPKKKYRKGYTVFSISELAIGLLQGKWYYYDDKVLHFGFFLNMSFNTIIGAINRKIIHEAVDQKKEYYAKLQEEYLKKTEVTQ